MQAPDPNEVLQAQIDTLKNRVSALESKAGTPAPTASDAQKFMEKWGPLPPEDFMARYGVEPLPGHDIPQMTAYAEEEAVFRARYGYTTFGKTTSSWSASTGRLKDTVRASVTAIAEATGGVYENGYLACDNDVAAYLFLCAIVKPQAEFAAGLGAGPQPRDYAGVTLEGLLAPNFTGGKPSGG